MSQRAQINLERKAIIEENSQLVIYRKQRLKEKKDCGISIEEHEIQTIELNII